MAFGCISGCFQGIGNGIATCCKAAFGCCAGICWVIGRFIQGIENGIAICCKAPLVCCGAICGAICRCIQGTLACCEGICDPFCSCFAGMCEAIRLMISRCFQGIGNGITTCCKVTFDCCAG